MIRFSLVFSCTMSTFDYTLQIIRIYRCILYIYVCNCIFTKYVLFNYIILYTCMLVYSVILAKPWSRDISSQPMVTTVDPNELSLTPQKWIQNYRISLFLLGIIRKKNMTLAQVPSINYHQISCLKKMPYNYSNYSSLRYSATALKILWLAMTIDSPISASQHCQS